eukprot:CAMPEP_0172199252 /NCGR_PEP_ID=MMETSP1050-20130122/28575_1 /TAXON_ID=233186 /ORGANISM="Cryptomonas curvata, Strain CCAP979/52" /LENGTH=225 /DNA_ID=CAMNT_0012876235 /DNA_START=79 /DNA_END=752 /DNA_ORIENTATION=+
MVKLLGKESSTMSSQSWKVLPNSIPGSWKINENKVFESHRICVVMHPSPCSLGHLIIFAKGCCERVQDADKDDLAAIGLMLPAIKRAARIVTGFRCFVLLMRSGPSAWSGCSEHIPQLHIELVPTIASRPGYELNWDPEQRRRLQKDGLLTLERSSALVQAVRIALGYRSSEKAGTVLCETDRFQAELVSDGASVGHCMVSPKRISPDLEDVDAMDLSACMSCLP